MLIWVLILVLIHLFVLIIRGWRELHLIAKVLVRSLILRLCKDCQLSVVLDYLIAEQHLLNYLVVGPLVLEEMIVHFTASTWIHPDHVASPVILLNRFSDVFFVFEVGCFFHGLEEGRVFDRVLVHEPLNVAL